VLGSHRRHYGVGALGRPIRVTGDEPGRQPTHRAAVSRSDQPVANDVQSQHARFIRGLKVATDSVPYRLAEGLEGVSLGGLGTLRGRCSTRIVGWELHLVDTATGSSQVVFSSPRELIGGPMLAGDLRAIYAAITQAQGNVVLADLTAR
jgi:hypothetical protein